VPGGSARGKGWRGVLRGSKGAQRARDQDAERPASVEHRPGHTDALVLYHYATAYRTGHHCTVPCTVLYCGSGPALADTARDPSK